MYIKIFLCGRLATCPKCFAYRSRGGEKRCGYVERRRLAGQAGKLFDDERIAY